MLTKRAQEIILKTALICSVSGAGYYVGTQTDAVNSIVYAKSVYKTTTTTSMRDGMANDEKLITKIPSNQAVDVITVYKNGAWAKVRWNGRTGYIRTMYLKLSKSSDQTSAKSSSSSAASPSGQSQQSDGYHMVTAKSIALRKSASSSSTKLATLPAGKDFLLIDKKGSYYKISVGGRYGWIPISAAADYGRTASAGSTASDRKTTSGTTAAAKSAKSNRSDGYHMVTTGSVNIRSGAGRTTNRLGTLPGGTDVLIINKTGDWLKIYVNGRYGYVHEDYLADYGTAKADQATQAAPGKTNSSSSSSSSDSPSGKSLQSDGYHMVTRRQTVLKRGPGTSYQTRTTLAEGTDLLIIDQDGGWYKVRYNGAYSWVKKADLTDYKKTSSSSAGSGSSDSGKTNSGSNSSSGSGSYRPVSIMITRQRVKLLAGPNSDFNSRATLPAGTEVTVLNDWGYYVKVSYNGKDGYIHMKDLKKASGYKSPSATGNSGSGSTGSSGTTQASPQQLGGTRSSSVDIKDMGSYSDISIKVSGTVENTSVSKVSVFLDGTYLGNARVSGRSFSYTIPSNVTRPGESSVRVQAATGKGLLYQTESFTVAKTPTIVIDPGHGGHDSGAVGTLDGRSIYEKDYDIKFANILRDELKAMGFNVIMTRAADFDVERATRVAISSRYNADLYFSVHHNGGFPNASGGLTLYPSSQTSPSTQASFSESKELAQMLAKAYTQAGMSYRGAYKDTAMTGGTIYVLRNTDTRAILTEIGFISNPKDARKIVDSSFQRSLSKGLAKQVYNFFYD